MKLLGAIRARSSPSLGTNEPLLTVKRPHNAVPCNGRFAAADVANVHASEDMSFTINKGQTLSLVGESGCGKSTVGRSCLRLVEPLSGQITLEGKEIMEMNQARAARKPFGYADDFSGSLRIAEPADAID